MTASPTSTQTQDDNALACRSCGSQQLRRSRFRAPDVLYLAVLSWPVRCLECGRRHHVPAWHAGKASPSTAPHRRAEPATGRLTAPALLQKQPRAISRREDA